MNLALQTMILTITKAKTIEKLQKFRDKTSGKGAKWTKSSLNASKTPKSGQNPPKIGQNHTKIGRDNDPPTLGFAFFLRG